MKTVHARNVNEAYAIGMNMLSTSGIQEESRFGKVLVMPSPVTTTYLQPTERVLFDKKRDCNPFFHLMESLWMLDLNKKGKDFPCNLAISFRVNKDQFFDKSNLDMTVFNRSNDIIWGAYGANAVHMSILQEYIAACLDIDCGRYYQVSNNYHAYVDVLARTGIPDPGPFDLYEMGQVDTIPLVDDPDHWMEDLNTFMEAPEIGATPLYINNFFAHVAEPMRRSWNWYKNKDYPGALEMTEEIFANDWRLACHQWLTKRFEKHGRKKQVRKIAED